MRTGSVRHCVTMDLLGVTRDGPTVPRNADFVGSIFFGSLHAAARSDGVCDSRREWPSCEANALTPTLTVPLRHIDSTDSSAHGSPSPGELGRLRERFSSIVDPKGQLGTNAV